MYTNHERCVLVLITNHSNDFPNHFNSLLDHHFEIIAFSCSIVLSRRTKGSIRISIEMTLMASIYNKWYINIWPDDCKISLTVLHNVNDLYYNITNGIESQFIFLFRRLLHSYTYEVNV